MRGVCRGGARGYVCSRSVFTRKGPALVLFTLLALVPLRRMCTCTKRCAPPAPPPPPFPITRSLQLVQAVPSSYFQFTDEGHPTGVACMGDGDVRAVFYVWGCMGYGDVCVLMYGGEWGTVMCAS